ncbi:uncharacterized protein LOC113792802 isoform X2 [Dermatophagoides pteronyssinus]|uniref:uncharacterized protein LOC113792802 isoform X2 n=1 Tax=Dermatophagoides pteronyssinus TaxID=6956 RepID=UPI003F67792C
MDWFIGKTRRKDKDPNPSQQEDTKQYLHSAMLECTTSETKLREIVNLAEGLDYNEWLASHTIAFFEHINLLYGTISEFCSMSGCPDMSGPCNRQYLWVDEKGKRIKLTAPQYVDYVMTYAQKAINDESIFPTKFDREFPPTFVLTVKKIMKLLYHVVAHIYHSHFKEIVLLNLHPHLNCIFAHLILFNERFKLIEEKEVEVLHDLAVALRVYPSRQTLMTHNPHSNEQSRLQSEAGSINYLDKQDERRCMVDDTNNNITMATDYCNQDVITTQCRSISALDDYRNFDYQTTDENLEYLNDQKENQNATKVSNMFGVNSPMLVDEQFVEDSITMFQVNSPEPMMVEPMMSSENMPAKKCTFDIRNSLRERSISANAVLATCKSLETFTASPITRRSNSDRTSAKSNSALFFCATNEDKKSLSFDRNDNLFQSNTNFPNTEETC